MTPNKIKIELFDKLSLKIKEIVETNQEIIYQSNDEYSEDESFEAAKESILENFENIGILDVTEEIVNRAIYHYSDEIPNKIDRSSSKRISIDEFKNKFSHKMKKGYLAMDKNGEWFHFNRLPELSKESWVKRSIFDKKVSFFDFFELEKAKNWETSLIKLG